ncbi:hypothetical protein [Microbacterium cremeum]|uniref:hypothetical protein n=1 Tax=Microbacterium cremeum TaxID=2782169 RepID=UPI001888B428|nr:hypothetical protein [Microbacterium cremeum]
MAEDVLRARRIWVVCASALLLAGVVLFAAGVTPWLAPAAAVFCVTLAVGQRTSWPFALAAGVIVTTTATALVVRFTPGWGIGLVTGSAVLFGLIGLAGLVGFGLARQPRLVGRRALRVGVPVLAVPVGLMAIVAALTLTSGNLEWAMHNDAVWNLVTTRIMVEDGGLDAIAHPNPSPLTPGLLAMAIAVGRGDVAPGDLLAHDMSRFATFWLFATLAAALLAAMIGARSVHGGARAARITAAGIAAVIPISWFTFGFAAQFGFYNATLALVLLLATWLAWLEARTVPIAAATVLSLATVALLATWAPLAFVPFALAAVALVARLAALPRGRAGARGFGLILLAVAPVVVYVLAVTLPDLRRDGAALAVDGGIMALQLSHVVVIVTVTIGVAVLNAVQRNQIHQLVGVAVVCAAGAVAGGYLMWQRAGTASLWGYYPAKFAWLLVSLLLVILAAALAGEMAGLRARRLATAGTAIVAIAVPVSLMWLVPPDRISSALTPVAIAAETGVASGAPAAQTLFELAEPGERTLALSYLDPSSDRFLNSWLLQLESRTAEEPIRYYSYVLDPENEEQACDAVRAWAAPVRIVTSDPTLPESFAELCTDVDVTVDVLEP